MYGKLRQFRGRRMDGCVYVVRRCVRGVRVAGGSTVAMWICEIGKTKLKQQKTFGNAVRYNDTGDPSGDCRLIVIPLYIYGVIFHESFRVDFAVFTGCLRLGRWGTDECDNFRVDIYIQKETFYSIPKRCLISCKSFSIPYLLAAAALPITNTAVSRLCKLSSIQQVVQKRSHKRSQY